MTPEKMQEIMMMVRMLKKGEKDDGDQSSFKNYMLPPRDPQAPRYYAEPPGEGAQVFDSPEAAKREALRRQRILMDAMKNQQKGPF